MSENEWNVLRLIDHPSILRLIDVYQD
jgi:calcium-dependent protein kinase